MLALMLVGAAIGYLAAGFTGAALGVLVVVGVVVVVGMVRIEPALIWLPVTVALLAFIVLGRRWGG